MKIETGKFYRTKSGLKVGPATPIEGLEIVWDIPLDGEFLGYHADGTVCIDEPDWNIVSEWSDDPLPYGHVVIDGETVDLTAITTPFGLLSEAVQEALRDHGGPYDVYRMTAGCVTARWHEVPEKPIFAPDFVYRARPEPKRRTLTMYGKLNVFKTGKIADDNLRITTTLTDGQWPLGTFVNQDGQTIVVEVEG